MSKKEQASYPDQPEMSVLSSQEWAFDNVPEEELASCRLWEYARESAFIRDTKCRCEDPKTMELSNRQLHKFVGQDIEIMQTLGYEAEVFLRGFFFKPDGEKSEKQHPNALAITGSFPRPWQWLSAAEQKARSHIRSDRTTIPLVPFERSPAFFAEWIAEYCHKQRAEAFRQQGDVRAWHLEAKKTDLSAADMLTAPDVRPSLSTAGAEVGVFKIEWSSFTNEEIREGFYQWLRTNRPKVLPKPDGRGHKTRDLRVALDRLGMMRLLQHFTLREMPTKCAEAWKAFAGYDWYKERKRALHTFHKLFPFLPKWERPLSWPTKGGRSK